ncbi:unnamed protein product [Brassica oleracea var. botrytis]
MRTTPAPLAGEAKPSAEVMEDLSRHPKTLQIRHSSNHQFRYSQTQKEEACWSI